MPVGEFLNSKTMLTKILLTHNTKLNTAFKTVDASRTSKDPQAITLYARTMHPPSSLMTMFTVPRPVMIIGSKSRTERLRKTKIGAEVAHVTRDADTAFKVRRSKVKVTCEEGAYCGGLPRTDC